MATVNPFDLLGDDDIEDPSQLIAAQQQKVPAQAKKAPAPAPATSHQQPAKLPSKPPPPVQAAREAKVGGEHGGGYVCGRGGYGRGGNTNTENAYGSRDFSVSRGTIDDRESSNPSERQGSIGGPRTSVHGGSRGRFNNGKGSDGEQPRRAFECRSGTGHRNEMKREGAGRGNWELLPMTFLRRLMMLSTKVRKSQVRRIQIQ